MAEGFLRDLAGDRFDVVSAGYEPSSKGFARMPSKPCAKSALISRDSAPRRRTNF